MPDESPVQPLIRSDHVGPGMRVVADDMAAIFGAESRVATTPVVVRRPAKGRSPARRKAIAATAAGALITMVVSGIYAGASAVGDPVTAPAARSDRRASPASERVALDGSAVVADADVATVAPVPEAEEMINSDERPAVAEAAVDPDVPTSSAVAPPPAVTVEIARAPSPVIVAPRPTAVSPRPAPTPAPSQEGGCDDDSDACLAEKASVAHQRVAAAYAQAVAAGVKARDLRGYRSEWDRARGEMAERPDYALRLYAMIASDLVNLAEDAQARDGATPR